MEPDVFLARGKVFPLTRTYVMGILNVTPDSFSDGGRFFSVDKAVSRAVAMKEEGADLIDIGGQSTRPGYTAVSPQEEWERIAQVVPAVAKETGLPVSVDTFYPWVADKALKAGAHMVNDVKGFGEEMLRAVSGSGCGCVVMFPQGGNGGNIFREAADFFSRRLELAERLGVSGNLLCFDPGIGFGKSREEDLALLSGVKKYKLPGSALLMAASRKRVTGAYCGNPPAEKRLPATLAAHTAAILGGADFIRVHDVEAGVQAAKMADALKACQRER